MLTRRRSARPAVGAAPSADGTTTALAPRLARSSLPAQLGVGSVFLAAGRGALATLRHFLFTRLSLAPAIHGSSRFGPAPMSAATSSRWRAELSGAPKHSTEPSRHPAGPYPLSPAEWRPLAPLRSPQTPPPLARKFGGCGRATQVLAARLTTLSDWPPAGSSRSCRSPRGEPPQSYAELCQLDASVPQATANDLPLTWHDSVSFGVDFEWSPHRTDECLDVPSRLDTGFPRRWEMLSELREGPIPTVIDTSCVRTGLQDQLKKGRLPASIRAAEEGHTRLFMEYDTLIETWERLPRFAQQLDVPLIDLQGLFCECWLPLISVVRLPDGLRELDERARAVRDLDAEDYPTAALAALLSPCILLTRNHKHFGPLGIQAASQGVDAVFAALDLRVGETRVQAVAMVPAAPVLAVGGATKWAYEKVGPLALVILGLILVGGTVFYRRQPPERKETVKKVAGGVGEFLMTEANAAMQAVQQAENQLTEWVVPGPAKRSVTSAVFRTLATGEDSMSAQQLCETLRPEVRPAVAPLRDWLHGNKTTVFKEVRYGSFQLGWRYRLTKPRSA